MSAPAGAGLEYGTAIRRTAVVDAAPGEGAEWIRTAPHPDHPFVGPVVGAPQTRAVPPAGTGHRFVVGAGHARRRRYDLPTGESMAAAALADPVLEVDWPAVYRGWGELLGVLHRGSARGTGLGEPPARTRLRRWWSGPRDATPSRREARRRFIDGLDRGTRRHLDRILGEDLTGHDAVLHGWAGLGQCVRGPGGEVVAIVGEDVGAGPPEYDLGALVAQAVEFAVFSPPGASPSPHRARDALLDGYRSTGRSTPDPERLAAHCIEHVVRHVADFTWFADFPPNEIPRWSHLVGWLDENRRRGLAP